MSLSLHISIWNISSIQPLTNIEAVPNASGTMAASTKSSGTTSKSHGFAVIHGSHVFHMICVVMLLSGIFLSLSIILQSLPARVQFFLSPTTKGNIFDSSSKAAIDGSSWQLPASALEVYPLSAATWLDSSNPESIPTTGSLTIDPASFRLHIKVLGYNRIPSLLRCLHSLVSAHYDVEPVFLDIIIDNPHNASRPWTEESVAGVHHMQKLLAALHNFSWPHGPKRVNYRWQNAGLQPQWVEAWYPDSPNEFAFIVEDDMEVSPLYYRYLKRLLAHYYFDASNFNARMFGISFQRQYYTPGESTRST